MSKPRHILGFLCLDLVDSRKDDPSKKIYPLCDILRRKKKLFTKSRVHLELFHVVAFIQRYIPVKDFKLFLRIFCL